MVKIHAPEVAPTTLFREAPCEHRIVSNYGRDALRLPDLGNLRHNGGSGRQGGNRPCGRPSARRQILPERYRANPKDVDAALQYAKALRAAGQRAQAVALLEQASIANPSNRMLLAGYGRALADNGHFQQAFDVLGRAHSPDEANSRKRGSTTPAR